MLEPSWRSTKGSFTDEDAEPIEDLPDIKEGDVLIIKQAAVLKKKPKPPVLYTEAGLLSATETTGKDIENEE